jgi:hypothetical protein
VEIGEGKGMIDPKLANTLDFVQGFTLSVTVIYEKGTELSPFSSVFFRIDSMQGQINITVTREGLMDLKLTQEARSQAARYLEGK